MTKSPLLNWDKTQYQGSDGILVAADENQEWLLKWWWNHYSKHNNYPVTFFDIGMSKSARTWCQTKGNVQSFSLPDGWIKKSINPKLIKEWEKRYPGDLWKSRKQWFNKPFLLLKSPYQRSIWIDLDCEVRRPLQKLFDYCNEADGFSALKLELPDSKFYSTGVVVSRHNSPVVKKWAENTHKHNEKYHGDEDSLIETLEKGTFKITPYSLLYNWPTFIPQNAETVIRHHIGGYGKTRILRGLDV